MNSPAETRRSVGLPSPSPHVRLNLQLSIARDDSGRETLWADIPELTVHQAVGVSKPPFVCGAVATPEDIYSPKSGHANATAIDCGGDGHEGHSSIRIFDDTLVLGDAQLAVPSNSSIAHDSVEQPFPPKLDCGSAVGPLLRVTLSREAKGVYLRIPELNVSRHLFPFGEPPPRFCATTRYKRANRLRLECVLGESSTTIELRAQNDVLFIEQSFLEEVSETVQRSRLGIQLPCNARLDLQGFSYRAPGYTPHTLTTCDGECFMVHDECERRCFERFSDENAELTAEGFACTDPCRTAQERCNQRCVARHAH